MEIRELKTIGQADRTTDAFQENASQAIERVNELLKYLRPTKPGFRRGTANTIVVDANTKAPRIFKIGDAWQTASSELVCDVRRTGAGGLDRGVLAANTAYYLYAVYVDRRVQLVASVHPPSQGPEVSAEWTYLGAFATREGSATVCEFQSVNGVTAFDDDIESEAHTGDLYFTAYTFESLPVTAKVAFCKILTNGAGGVEDLVGANGTGTSNNYPLVQRSQVLNVDNYGFGAIPLTTPQRIYLVTSDATQTVTVLLTGWREDPSEWK